MAKKNNPAVSVIIAMYNAENFIAECLASLANQTMQDFEIIVHPRCVNFLTEISCYTWATDKFGNRTNVPIDDFNHMMDAMRYALEDNIRKKKWLV